MEKLKTTEIIWITIGIIVLIGAAFIIGYFFGEVFALSKVSDCMRNCQSFFGNIKQNCFRNCVW